MKYGAFRSPTTADSWRLRRPTVALSSGVFKYETYFLFVGIFVCL